MTNEVDIRENDIKKLDIELLKILLQDHTTKKNIIWATDNYMPLGDGYSEYDEITIKCITGENGQVIKPRTKKTKDEQIARVRDKAEVFTPSWVCNKQINLIDNDWFKKENVFNKEIDKSWQTNEKKIHFPTKEKKTWHDYVEDVRLEITCGEAPYLVSRYDTITGEIIPIKQRIGMLDRKMRVIDENTQQEKEWFENTIKAYKSIYGYEWQGDNLLIARENLLFSFIDYYKQKFGIRKKPKKEDLEKIANIISWNIWQMDGLKGVVPYSCKSTKVTVFDLFGEKKDAIVQCEGCKRNDIHKHNGLYCKIKDWGKNKEINYISLSK